MGHVGNDSGVLSLEWLGLDESVLIGAQKLPLVVGTSISNDDLGGVLVGHDHRGLRESASECIWVVWLQWLLQHSSVEILPHLVVVLRERGHLWQPLLAQINWLRSTVIKCQAHKLSIFLEDLAARCDFSIFEGGRGSVNLLIMDFGLSFHSLMLHHGLLLLNLLLLLQLFL